MKKQIQRLLTALPLADCSSDEDNHRVYSSCIFALPLAPEDCKGFERAESPGVSVSWHKVLQQHLLLDELQDGAQALDTADAVPLSCPRRTELLPVRCTRSLMGHPGMADMNPT
ncbi:unnamed protein product [Cladocopium goreaui]|uniref:Uncharacterized protein n=1 Tax=Cladocopium goreaui TaxID=2562237 RepID=A0A9P1BQX3_9DINO|nr:unnamed protein product [Cladocopium goreaui]